MRFCLIFLVAVPAFAASPEHATAVVRADQKSGRLVRTIIPVVSIAANPVSVQPRVIESRLAGTPQASAATAPDTGSGDVSALAALADQIAVEMGVEESLVQSVIRAESNFQTRAVSPKGAQGLMQLIPSTARRFGVADVFNAKDNIQGGVRYLRFLLEYYQNDYPKAIAAYNAGEGAVDKYHGIPPYPETQNYVYRVAKNLKIAREAKAQAAVSAKVLVAGTDAAVDTSETFKPIRTSVGEDGRVYYRTP